MCTHFNFISVTFADVGGKAGGGVLIAVGIIVAGIGAYFVYDECTNG